MRVQNDHVSLGIIRQGAAGGDLLTVRNSSRFSLTLEREEGDQATRTTSGTEAHTSIVIEVRLFWQK